MKSSKRILQPRNRRTGDRLKLNLPLKSESVAGRTLNISRTGLRYLVPRRVAPGEQQRLSVEFQNGTVECLVEPVWIHNLGVSSVVGARIVDAEGLAGMGKQVDGIVKATQDFFAPR